MPEGRREQADLDGDHRVLTPNQIEVAAERLHAPGTNGSVMTMIDTESSMQPITMAMRT